MLEVTQFRLLYKLSDRGDRSFAVALRFRNQVFHSFKASDSIGAFGLAPCGEQIRIVILFLLFVVILYNV